MEKFSFKQIAMIIVLAAIALAGCENEDDPSPVTVTQNDLDQATNFIKSATGDFPHGGPDGISGDSTIREVFSDISELTGDIPPGTIVTKKTYKKGPDGNKTDQLFVSFAMVKRESGYDPDNGNWEYAKIPFDASVDYEAHPFGMLPDEGNGRGKISSCITCHAKAGGGDYLYSNDE